MVTMAQIEASPGMQRALLPGETVLWRGGPEHFPLMKGAGRSVMLTWLCYTAVFLIVSGLFLWAELAVGAEFNVVWQFSMTLVYLFFMARPLQDWAKVRRSAYFVTDRRVLVALGGKDFHGLNRKSLKVRSAPSAPGNRDLLLGAAVGIPDKKHFKRACDPNRDENDEEITGFVFYNIKEDPALRELLAY